MKILIRLFFALFIVIFIFWNRLIRIRVPRAITDITFTITPLIIVGFLLLFNIFSIIICLNQIFNKIKPNKFIEKLLENTIFFKLSKYIELITESPKFIYDYLADNFINFKKIIELPASYLAVYVYYPKIIVFFLIFIPRIIVATIFLLDVIYFHYFYYFYKSLILLLVPIVTACYRHMISFHSITSLEFVHQYVNIIHHNGGVEFTLKPEPPPTEYALTLTQMKDKFYYLINVWRINSVLKTYTELLYETEKTYKPYVTLYVSVCYLIAWSYILFI